MVNKVALLVLGVVILTSVGVGALVGLQFGPGEQAATTPTSGAGTPTAASPTPTASGTGTATVSPTARPTVAPAAFDRAEIEAALFAEVNAYREANGLETLYAEPELREMARFHSENMADEGELSHTAGGFTTAQRYERFDQDCRVSNNADRGTLTGDALEALEYAVAGRPYEADGETRYHRNESAIAAAVLQDWNASADASKRLNLEDATHVGIGVHLTTDGEVYVTLNLC